MRPVVVVERAETAAEQMSVAEVAEVVAAQAMRSSLHVI